ncbi:cytidylyltransferase domain-containing protein [Halobacillus amylolyticus]|uniref:UDP-2,4-diacetamido-2,4, 6-trideoxy-beta-L-altropyranose hydrolase n=1 Tax=Halobacillus amylolyticus TaxID=2932259 RepID=A0ABY4H8X0_9BACI|nr:glycosyltransferase [Halobacillus amylolyticus]UOR11318.1 UDP-2,4-diacetamido-2,4,6-trideoxy-beta-L-altropyranose hydrolase [Halobacillus amylolyticus]
MKILVVIPARGGSKGIPRKNVRLMCGKPLISYSIKNALCSTFNLDVVVSTDDEEIERIAESHGAKVIKRPNELATDQVTLDPVIHHTLLEMERGKNVTYDYVVTMQPTSPLLTTRTLDEAIKDFSQNSFDTVISGINSPHLSWTEKDGIVVPLYKERLNRQYLPKNLIETGAFVITKREFVEENSRLGPSVSIYEVPENESIDIDSPQDWWVAEKELSKKIILIRTDGYAEIGLGHIYRCLLLAHNLIDHEVRFILTSRSDIGIKKIRESHFKYHIIEDDYDIDKLINEYQCNILVNDILDTTEEYVKYCKGLGVRVVNFEDLGPGGLHADAVINDLYEKRNDYKNYYWGSDYYCIRDEFLLAKPAKFNEEVQEVLIIFGGTDPCNLTYRTFDALKTFPYKNIHYTFILGMGYSHTEELVFAASKSSLNIDIVSDVKRMTELMGKADIAISSQGRTMLELASMAVPTILLAQNEREQHHEFGYLQNGFINLGFGNIVEDRTIRETLLWLISSPQIRKQMKEQMLKNDLKKGAQRVINLILDRDL